MVGRASQPPWDWISDYNYIVTQVVYNLDWAGDLMVVYNTPYDDITKLYEPATCRSSHHHVWPASDDPRILFNWNHFPSGHPLLAVSIEDMTQYLYWFRILSLSHSYRWSVGRIIWAKTDISLVLQFA